MLISLALFLTLFIMMPTLQVIYDQAIQPLVAEDITEMEALDLAAQPVREFMLGHVREQDLQLFVDLSNTGPIAIGASQRLRRCWPCPASLPAAKRCMRLPGAPTRPHSTPHTQPSPRTFSTTPVSCNLSNPASITLERACTAS